MEFVKISLAKFERSCDALAEKIRESRFRPDVILGIARGGLVPAVYLSDALNVHHLAVVQIKLYKGQGKRGRLRFLDYTRRNLRGKKVLIVDDVSDTGKTLCSLERRLYQQGVKKIRVACLHTKPGTLREPDYYALKTDAWVQYPWNKKEEFMASKLKKAKSGGPNPCTGS